MSTATVTVKIALGDGPDIEFSANEQRCTVSIDDALIESSCSEEMRRLGLACLEAARAKDLCGTIAAQVRREAIEKQYAKTFEGVTP